MFKLEADELAKGHLYHHVGGYFGEGRYFEVVSVGRKWITYRTVIENGESYHDSRNPRLGPRRKLWKAAWRGRGFIHVARSFEEFRAEHAES